MQNRDLSRWKMPLFHFWALKNLRIVESAVLPHNDHKTDLHLLLWTLHEDCETWTIETLQVHHDIFCFKKNTHYSNAFANNVQRKDAVYNIKKGKNNSLCWLALKMESSEIFILRLCIVLFAWHIGEIIEALLTKRFYFKFQECNYSVGLYVYNSCIYK